MSPGSPLWPSVPVATLARATPQHRIPRLRVPCPTPPDLRSIGTLLRNASAAATCCNRADRRLPRLRRPNNWSLADVSVAVAMGHVTTDHALPLPASWWPPKRLPMALTCTRLLQNLASSCRRPPQAMTHTRANTCMRADMSALVVLLVCGQCPDGFMVYSASSLRPGARRRCYAC